MPAQTYDRGEVYDISLDNIDQLAKNGTDLIPGEKEGIAEIFAPLANMTGIVILNSRGFFTENAIEFTRLVQDKLGDNHGGYFGFRDAANNTKLVDDGATNVVFNNWKSTTQL